MASVDARFIRGARNGLIGRMGEANVGHLKLTGEGMDRRSRVTEGARMGTADELAL